MQSQGHRGERGGDGGAGEEPADQRRTAPARLPPRSRNVHQAQPPQRGLPAGSVPGGGAPLHDPRVLRPGKNPQTQAIMRE